MAPRPNESLNAKENTHAAPASAERGSVLDDPFGSMYVGLIAPAAAVGAVVSGIFGLSLFY